MADLYHSFVVMTLFCSGTLYVGAELARRTPRSSQRLILIPTVVLMFVYLTCIWDRPIVTRLIPSSAAIIWGNWLPLFGCFFAGICARTVQVQLWRRISLGLITSILSIYSLCRPMVGEPPSCILLSKSGALQFQTAETTCSAVSGACVLRMHGLRASEHEMARLCLTRHGTHWLGLYRGMKLKSADSDWDVVVDTFDPHGDLQEQIAGPAVLSLTFHGQSGSQLTARGFTEQSGHSVVVLEALGDGRLKIFDPAPEFGHEIWDQTMLNDIREAVIVRLVRRDPRQKPLVDPIQLAARENPQP